MLESYGNEFQEVFLSHRPISKTLGNDVEIGGIKNDKPVLMDGSTGFIMTPGKAIPW